MGYMVVICFLLGGIFTALILAVFKLNKICWVLMEDKIYVLNDDPTDPEV